MLPNYYKILDIARAATPDDITAAIKKQRRKYQSLQGNPQVQKRQLAERMMTEIAEAEKILLDAGQRRTYDQRLAAQVEPPQPAASGGGRDWLAIAHQYLDSGQVRQAEFAAREATTQQSENPEAWYVRAVASGELEQWSDAEFCVSEAIRLNPNKASYHCQLGDIYNQNNVFAKARDCYTRASALEPDNPYYVTGIAATYIGEHQPDKALELLHTVVIQNPDVDIIKEHYAMALLDDALSKWSRVDDEGFMILSEAQLALTRRRIAEVEALKVTDPVILEGLAEHRRLADQAEKITWRPSFYKKFYAGASIACLLVLAFLLEDRAGVAGVLVLWGLLTAGIIALYVVRHRMPEWRSDRKDAPAHIARTGLQDGGS